MAHSTDSELQAFPFGCPRSGPFDPPHEERAYRLSTPMSRVALPGGGVTWLAARHADVRQVLRDPSFSADITAPGFPLVGPVPPQDDKSRAGAFIRMDPPEHTLYRRLLTPEFMVKAVQRLEPLIVQTVDRFLDELEAAGAPADFVEHFALPVPSMVISHLLGVPYEEHEFFQRNSHTLLDNHAAPEAMMAAMGDLRESLGKLVELKRREPADDLTSRLAQQLDAGTLTHDDVVGVALLLLIAGHETTANMLGLGTFLLLRSHPEEWAALVSRPERAPALVDELLRYLTIVHHGLPRIATQDVQVGEQLVRAGEGVIVLLSAANRDAAVFADPDRFDVDRGAQQHVSFGFGMHQCIGQPLARAELRIAFTRLAARLPGLALAPEAGQTVLRPDSFIYGVHKLFVRW
ncbi:cytochrome P450 [Dactylosporangium sp. CS-047395]|uniref:cytochrome P450 n=1 Tax=Dactylosporangium sp. CS-047395 TaxID=3239936 RepID=UPI003D8CF6D4